MGAITAMLLALALCARAEMTNSDAWKEEKEGPRVNIHEHHEDDPIVKSKHARWFKHNKTRYWKADGEDHHPADQGWEQHHYEHAQTGTDKQEWAHREHGHAMQGGGTLNHHAIREPMMAHVVGVFHPTRLKRHDEGTKQGADHKLYFSYDGRKISPWHDIPLIAGETHRTEKDIAKHGMGKDTDRKSPGAQHLYHMLCETPKGSDTV